MRLKINWGGGIVIAIATMVTGMLVLVYIAVKQDFSLVEKDYYQKAVNYQQQIDKIQNANSLDEKLKIVYSNKNLKLQFPSLFQDEIMEGTIQLYNAVNEENDLNIQLKLNENLSQEITLNKLTRGRYKVKVEWKAGDKEFYQELEIMHQ